MGSTELRRSVGFWAFVIYGVGDILGAGIYALIGKVAAIAGTFTWLAFLLALITAGLTAVTYAELGTRYQKSGGEATYVQKVFSIPLLTFMTGWFVLNTSMVSMATVSHAFSAYASIFVPWVPTYAWILFFLLTLAVINFVGINFSSSVNILFTMVELSGLALVILFGTVYLLSDGPLHLPATKLHLLPILQAGALSFFAFIGFEDMVKLAEELKSPTQHIAKGIILALAIAGAIYLTISWMVPYIVPQDVLSASDSPLLEVVKKTAPWFPLEAFSLMAVFAVSNTALLNFISGSRLLYGMANEGALPKVFGRVHPSTQTPHWSILFMLLFVIPLAFLGDMKALAGTTTALLLTVFCLLNITLICLKRKESILTLTIPLLGAIMSLLLILFAPTASLGTAALISGFGLALFLLYKFF